MPIDPGRPLRVAHISDCFAPRTGGIETQVAALAEHQQRSGMDVRVITATKGGAQPIGLHVERVVANMPWDLPIHPRTRAHVQRLLAADPVDVVHVHLGAVSPFAWGGVRAARRLGLPTVITVHSMWGPFARFGYRLSAQVTGWQRWNIQMSAVSAASARTVQAAIGGDVLVLPNGIDPALWHVARREPRGSGPLRLISVLRLAPRKRVLPLLEMAAAASAQTAAGISLTIVGDGPARHRATSRAATLMHRTPGLSVQFTGRLDRIGILEHFAQADLFVQPSVRESFGLAALEARCAGIPVLARTQSGSGTFVVNQQSGILVPTDQAMTAALVELASDPSQLERLRVGAGTAVQNVGWPVVLQAVHDAYRRVMR